MKETVEKRNFQQLQELMSSLKSELNPSVSWELPDCPERPVGALRLEFQINEVRQVKAQFSLPFDLSNDKQDVLEQVYVSALDRLLKPDEWVDDYVRQRVAAGDSMSVPRLSTEAGAFARVMLSWVYSVLGPKIRSYAAERRTQLTRLLTEQPCSITLCNSSIMDRTARIRLSFDREFPIDCLLYLEDPKAASVYGQLAAILRERFGQGNFSTNEMIRQAIRCGSTRYIADLLKAAEEACCKAIVLADALEGMDGAR